MISDNIITNNIGGLYGGGIYCNWYATPVISSNTISGNKSDIGGGVYCANESSVKINFNNILNNKPFDVYAESYLDAVNN